MSPPLYGLGLDYGTGAVRALVVSLADGREAGSGTAPYPSGEEGVIADEADPHLARQHPGDYEKALEQAVAGALGAAAQDPDFAAERIIGIGIDATASTPLPVDSAGRPLAASERFAKDPAALAWLWKDHTSHAEAEEITELARRECPERLARSGGSYSSEWFFAKLLRCRRVAPHVLESAAGWVELGDHIAGFLTGGHPPDRLRRNACAAGHKALFHEELGLPPGDFFERLDSGLGRWIEGKLYGEVFPSSEPAGTLAPGWARRLGLAPGIAVAMAGIDAHVGAVGAGIRPGIMVKILGTSSCDMLAHPAGDGPLDAVPGLCGVVKDSVLPDHWGLEAGQSAVGDIFGWFTRELAPGSSHRELAAAASRLRPGESGLLALDWLNGNRSLLNDPRLSGLLVGQTLRTRPHEIYRALLESTAFGARLIMDRIIEHGVEVKEIIVCGGIAEKNPLLLQIYADVLERPLKLSRSPETCALGAAIFGAVAAGSSSGGPATVEEAQSRMCGLKETVYRPREASSAVYARLLALYRTLHDAFAESSSRAPLGHVMKELLDLAASSRSEPRDDAREGGGGTS